MTTWTHLADPAVVSTLGWTLIHFLWQGAMLATVMTSALRWTNAAENRYRIGVATLLAMAMAPVVTFAFLSRQQAGSLKGLGPTANASVSAVASTINLWKTGSTAHPTWNWAEVATVLWLAGVFLFGLRAAGGWWMLSRLGKRWQEAVPEPILLMCQELRRRMGIRRVVRFCASAAVDAPAVLGWFRPIVLLPLASISGLSLEQLEAVIAHELAHIRRLDAFVNVLQVAVETLLFYHPAVWWVSRVIRVEREHCCDDVAVGVRGDAVDYARALALMEESRLMPQWALAANSRPLRDRVARLLGVKAPARQLPASLLLACFVMASGAALLAERPALSETLTMIEERFYSTPAVGVPHSVLHAEGVTSTATSESSGKARINRQTAKTDEMALTNLVARGNAESAESRVESAFEAEPQAEAQTGHSYIDEMASAGYPDLTVDQLVELKVQGVTAAYVREVADAGLHPDIHQLIALKVQGVTGSYVRDIRATGLDPDLKHVIALKVQGVDAEYIRGLMAAGLHPDLKQVIAMKIQGVDANYIKGLKAAGIDADLDHVIAMKVQGITADYARAVRAAGWNPTANDLIALKVQDVQPSDAAEFGKLGFTSLSMHDLLNAKIQGVTPGYVKAMRAAGVSADSLSAYVNAKIQGVTPEFVEKAKQHGFKDLTLDKLVRLRMADVL